MNMVRAFPIPDPMRPNGTQRARATTPSQQPPASPPPGTTTTTTPTTAPQQPPSPGLWPPRAAPGPLPAGVPGGMVGAHGGPATVGALGALRRLIVPAFAQVPSRVISVPRGQVRSQLSRGPRPGRSTAFHDYTGSSVGSESGHYARVKGFTS